MGGGLSTRSTIWVVLAVSLVLLGSTAGTGIVAGAGTSAVVSPHSLSHVDDLSCRSTAASYTLQNESAPEHEALCDQLLEAQQETGAETARLSREISELYQAVVDRQTELTAICPQDLSIIACTASAVDDARGEYADEIDRLTAERDASQERWTALMQERSRCIQAYYAGEDYEIDPAVAGLLADPTPGPVVEEPVPISTPIRGEVKIVVGGPDDVSVDEPPSDPVDVTSPAATDPDTTAAPGLEPQPRPDRLARIADRIQTQAGGALFPFEVMGGYMVEVVDSVANTVTGVWSVVTGQFFDDLGTGISDSWSAGSSTEESLINTASYLGNLINPLPTLEQGVQNIVDGFVGGDGAKVGKGMAQTAEVAVPAAGAVYGGTKAVKGVTQTVRRDSKLQKTAENVESAGNLADRASDSLTDNQTVDDESQPSTAPGGGMK